MYIYIVFVYGFIEQTKIIRPDEDAKFWCQAGLDKDGFEKRFINETIGIVTFILMYIV